MAEKKITLAGFQHRHDTVANWEAKNPVLLDGEQIVVLLEDGSIRYKTGYGGKTYSQLPFDSAGIDEASTYVKTTLLSTGWVNGRQTLSIAGLEATQNGNIGLAHEITDAQFEAASDAILRVCDQQSGSLTIKAYGVTPTIDIPVVVILLN